MRGHLKVESAYANKKKNELLGSRNVLQMLAVHACAVNWIGILRFASVFKVKYIKLKRCSCSVIIFKYFL